MPANGQGQARTQRYQSIRRTLAIVLALDLLLALAKGSYGYFSDSLGMISDGLHSGLHALGSIVGLVGVSLASQPPDPSHPYGYERYEPLAAMGIGVFMLAAVWGILNDAWSRLRTDQVPRVTTASFMIIAFAICLIVALAFWENRRAQALNSTVLRADAARVWSDTLASGTVIAGLVGVQLGFPGLDALASIVIAALIGWTAWRIVRGASRILADAAVADVEQIAEIVRRVEGVRGCHQVRARGAGGMVRVDLHITVDPEMTVVRSHELAEEVERRIRLQVGGIAEVLVHVGAATLH